MVHMRTDRLLAAALTAGIVWGALMFIAGLTATFGWMSSWVALWSNIYIGYAPGALGALVGLLWGFADAAIAVVVVAYIYRGISRALGQTHRAKEPRAFPRV